jgi:PDZ domain-containing protein
LVPRDLVFPPEKTRDDIQKSQNADFQRSEDNAQWAALNYLKYDKAVTVQTVTDPGPSVGKLQTGDALDAVNGVKTPTIEKFTGSAQGHQARPGDRDRLPPQERPARHRADHPGPEQGSRLRLPRHRRAGRPVGPFAVDFNLANIGGPSAGLMFSLAVVDKLTTGDLDGGKFIAGTGTIGPDGSVGPIGGITHKMSSAQEAGRACSWCPPTTATRPAPPRATPWNSSRPTA